MGFFSGGKSYSNSGLDNNGKLQQENLFSQLTANPYQSLGFNAPQNTMQLDENGLTAGQSAGFGEAVRQAISAFSGNSAAKGFLQPQAIGQIAGSAAMHVMPQFAPLMSQNLQAQFGQNFQNAQGQFGADQFNVQTQQNRFAQLLQAMGQRQISNGTTSGPGIGYNIASQFKLPGFSGSGGGGATPGVGGAPAGGAGG